MRTVHRGEEGRLAVMLEGRGALKTSLQNPAEVKPVG